MHKKWLIVKIGLSFDRKLKSKPANQSKQFVPVINHLQYKRKNVIVTFSYDFINQYIETACHTCFFKKIVLSCIMFNRLVTIKSKGLFLTFQHHFFKNNRD